MVRSASWSPNGDSLLFVRNDSVLARPVEGPGNRFIGRGTQLHSCVWSPDDRWIACTSGNWVAFQPGTLFGNQAPSAIVLFPVTGGAPVELTDRRTPGHRRRRWPLRRLVAEQRAPEGDPLPEVQAIRRLSGDQTQECSWGAAADEPVAGTLDRPCKHGVVPDEEERVPIRRPGRRADHGLALAADRRAALPPTAVACALFIARNARRHCPETTGEEVRPSWSPR